MLLKRGQETMKNCLKSQGDTGQKHDNRRLLEERKAYVTLPIPLLFTAYDAMMQSSIERWLTFK